MLVKNRMVKKLITIERNCTVVEALSLMKKYSSVTCPWLMAICLSA